MGLHHTGWVACLLVAVDAPPEITLGVCVLEEYCPFLQ